MGARKTAERNPARRKGARRNVKTGSLPPILPRPVRVRRRAGGFRFIEGMPLFLPARDPALDRSLLVAATRARARILEQTGITLHIERSRSPALDSPHIVCRIDRRAALSPGKATARDAYRLTVRTGGIEIAAPSVAGLRHGLQTLCQLATPSGRVPALDILDQPDFENRGIMLDVSRGKVPTHETLESLIELCSDLRVNVLMLYVEHTFAFRKHPEIGAGSSPLTAESVLALDAFAADRGVELIPCLQSLGHMERVLSIDRYAGLAESERHWSVSPGHPGTIRLLSDLYDEFLPLFRSTRFNANCDEPFDLGSGSSISRSPRRSPGALFTDHVRRLERLSKAHGKQLMIWADFAHKHPEELARLGRGIVLLDWWYEADFDADRIGRLRRRGFETWACPGTSTWNCLFPRVGNACSNIARWAEAGRRHGAKGLLNTDWGDFGHYNALGVSFHAYAWGAQQAWSGDVDDRYFDWAFGRQVFAEEDAILGRLHRRLGAIHDAGFRVMNGSALQYLYFDALGRSFFLQHAERAALERSARRIDPVIRRIEALGLAEAGGDFKGLARREFAWAASATRFAIEKSLAALSYNEWRRDPEGLDRSRRLRLARQLEGLAEEQTNQLDELQTLWLARNEISDFPTIRKRIRRSIAGLRGGARRLRRNAPPRPPKPSTLSLLTIYDEVRREMGMRPR